MEQTRSSNSRLQCVTFNCDLDLESAGLSYVFYTSSHWGVLIKILLRIQKIWSGHNSVTNGQMDGQLTDGRMDRWTDGRHWKAIPLILRRFGAGDYLNYMNLRWAHTRVKTFVIFDRLNTLKERVYWIVNSNIPLINVRTAHNLCSRLICFDTNKL